MGREAPVGYGDAKPDGKWGREKQYFLMETRYRSDASIFQSKPGTGGRTGRETVKAA